MTTPDLDLLREYAQKGSEAAFSALVNRHLNLVYSAALRQVRSPQLAEEVSQSVFADLARNARHLADNTVLGAWLYQVTRRTAIDVVRREARRQLREQIATELHAMNATAADWTHIEPILDEAMHALDDSDRIAVLLRYFENKSLREVGQTLGTSDDAAQKRVSRAVERLREFFAKRGVTVGASGLVVVISVNAVQAAPVCLAGAISAAALAGTTITTASTATAIKAIAMTTLQKTLITVALAAAVGTGIYEARHASQLHQQNETLHQQQAPLVAEIRQLQQERDDTTNRLALLKDELAKIKGNNLELMKLRNEITILKRNQAAVQTAVNSLSTQTEATGNGTLLQQNIGRQLGMAVVRGDAGAFDKLLAEIKAEQQSFSTNSPGLNDQERGEASVRAFTPINAAFKIIGDAAATGNQPALDALTRAMQIAELNGLAVNSLGSLAGNGDTGALEVLLHPEKYGALLSGTISALQPAADNGNQSAIDGLAAVANNQKNQALWQMTAQSLATAAAAGNPVAIDALINMSSSTNRNVQMAVAQGLRSAAANQNVKATQALRAMNSP